MLHIPKRYVNEEGLEQTFDLLKGEFDTKENNLEITEDPEIISFFDVDPLDMKYVSQEDLQEALNEEYY